MTTTSTYPTVTTVNVTAATASAIAPKTSDTQITTNTGIAIVVRAIALVLVCSGRINRTISGSNASSSGRSTINGSLRQDA